MITAEDEGTLVTTKEEAFIWEAVLAIAQGRAVRAGHEVTAKAFAEDCVEKAVALWDEYVLAIEGGPF